MAEEDAKKALKDAVKKLAEIISKGSTGSSDEKKTTGSNTGQAAQGAKTG